MSTNAAAPITLEAFKQKVPGNLGSTLLAEHPYSIFNYGKNNTVYICDAALNIVKTIEINIDTETEYEITSLDRYGNSDDIYDAYASQHFFNDDDLYEVVVRMPDSNGSWRIYRVYNENGECLGDLPCDPPRYFIDPNGTCYISSRDEDENGNDYISLYLPKTASSNVNDIKADNVGNLTITPTPAERNEQVFVTLPEVAAAGLSVRIFDVNGTLLLKHECQPGEKTIAIPAYRLASGVNPIVVMDADGYIIGTGKAVRK